MWMAGGGAKGGQIYGETDDFSYNIVKDPVHIRDFHATVLHLLGFDHERFTYRHLGLDQKLTGVQDLSPPPTTRPGCRRRAPCSSMTPLNATRPATA
jgi:hypothetical protein